MKAIVITALLLLVVAGGAYAAFPGRRHLLPAARAFSAVVR